MERRGPSVSTVIASWTIAIVQGLTRIVGATFSIEEQRPYRPDAYYMRGPGPKWREKHARERQGRDPDPAIRLKRRAKEERLPGSGIALDRLGGLGLELVQRLALRAPRRLCPVVCSR
jgi:hypothetical protein